MDRVSMHAYIDGTVHDESLRLPLYQPTSPALGQMKSICGLHGVHTALSAAGSYVVYISCLLDKNLRTVEWSSR